MEGWLVALALVAAYVTFVVWLMQTGRLQKWNLNTMLGLVLMVRTQRGKGAIEAISRPKRLWNALGDFGIVLTLTGMLLMTVLFLWSVWFTLQPDSGVKPLRASEILVIPGVNPFVPLWYGILALILTLVVHEGGHGVLARANRMGIKSLGLLFFVVPIGAFVEPDEADLAASRRRHRLRVFAAGPLLNLIFATLFLGAFVAGVAAAEPRDGVGVYGLRPDGPAELGQIESGDRILSVDGTPVHDRESFREALRRYEPGNQADIQLAGGEVHVVRFDSLWEGLSEGARQEILANEDGIGVAYCDSLDIEAASGQACADALQRRAALGVSVDDASARQALLTKPFGRDCDGTGARKPVCESAGFLTLIALPVGEIQGQPILSYLLPTFHEAPFAPAVFWPLVTLCFWMFWINLMVGLTNILPMLPLDGGHIFRDAIGGVVERAAPNASEEKRTKVVNRAALAVSLLILGAFLLQILGPRFVQ